jgi:hypothetical protein
VTPFTYPGSHAGSSDTEISDTLLAVSCGSSEDDRGQDFRRFLSFSAYPTTVGPVTPFNAPVSHAGSSETEISDTLLSISSPTPELHGQAQRYEQQHR